jgi:hypothetical protein
MKKAGGEMGNAKVIRAERDDDIRGNGLVPQLMEVPDDVGGTEDVFGDRKGFRGRLVAQISESHSEMRSGLHCISQAELPAQTTDSYGMFLICKHNVKTQSAASRLIARTL